MASESFGCHDISRHWWGASAGWESCCFGLLEGAGPVAVVVAVVVWVHCTRGGCYWTRVGGTGGRWGLRAVRTTLGQWIPTLVEQADSRRDSRRSRPRVIASRPSAQTAVRERWGGPVTKAPGSAARTPDSLLRDTVSTALTLMDRTSMFPVGIAGILRLFFGVRRRCACDVSTMDTHTPSCLAPKPPSPPGPPACPGFPPERVSQKS